MKATVALGLGALVALAAQPASACATCSCGNPALTTMGTEPPLGGRVRLSSSVRVWETEEDGAQLQEVRMDLTASWAPTPRWTFGVNVPLQARQVTDATLARQRAFGLGDVEVSARAVVLLDDRMKPRWVLGVIAGLRMPTAPIVSDASGKPLDVDAQPGAGAFVPYGGLSYSGFFSEQWSVYAAIVAELPVSARDGNWPGAMGRLYASLQLQPLGWLALRAGVEGRLEGPRKASGEFDPTGQGGALFAAPELLFSPQTDFTVLIGARVPIWGDQVGTHNGTALMASLVVDL